MANRTNHPLSPNPRAFRAEIRLTADELAEARRIARVEGRTLSDVLRGGIRVHAASNVSTVAPAGDPSFTPPPAVE